MTVVSVDNRINDGLHNNRAGNLERDRGLRARHTRTHATVDFAKDELHCLIDHFDKSSFIRLLGGNGLAFFRSMETEAMDLCIVEEPARILSEQKYGCVSGITVSQQIEILQNRLWGAISFEFQPTRGFGRFNKSRYLCFIDIPDRCPVTHTTIKWRRSEHTTILKAFDETGVDLTDQPRGIRKTTSGDLAARPAHQFGHFRFTRLVVISLNKDQAFTMSLGGVFKLQFSGRLPVLALPSVLVTENSKVNVPLFEFTQVDIVRFAISGRDVFEQKHIRNEPAQERVIRDEILHCAPFRREFLLNAADEKTVLVSRRFLR